MKRARPNRGAHWLGLPLALVPAQALAFLLAFVLALVLGGVTAPRLAAADALDNQTPAASTPEPSLGLADLRRLPQDPAFYLAQPGARAWSLSPARQRRLTENFRQEFFSPWRQQAPSQDRQQVRQAMAELLDTPGYGEDRWPRDQAWLKGLIDYAGLESYPNQGYAAISLAASDLRSLPTQRPLLEGFAHAGQGYAFDSLQQSLLPPNTPLYVVHASRDGAWLLCDSTYGLWWVQADRVARAGPALRRLWQGSPLAALVRDEVALKDQRGVYLFSAGVGVVLPLRAQGRGGLEVLVAAGHQGRAQPRRVRLAAGQARPWPQPLSASALAGQASVLLGKPYGWGGSYGNRDCSALLKDLFTPFGLWLPRNSWHQAQEGGLFISLAGQTPEQREQALLAQGVPFLTLVWRPGHIMLYLGAYQRRAVVLHSLWGLKTVDGQGREGRQVVGRSVITSLHAGEELPELIRPEWRLLQRVEGMTQLVPPGELTWPAGTPTVNH